MDDVTSSNAKAAEPTPKKDAKALFDGCRFIFVLSKTLPANLIQQVSFKFLMPLKVRSWLTFAV
jgi:hypothetical protein